MMEGRNDDEGWWKTMDLYKYKKIKPVKEGFWWHVEDEEDGNDGGWACSTGEWMRVIIKNIGTAAAKKQTARVTDWYGSYYLLKWCSKKGCTKGIWGVNILTPKLAALFPFRPVVYGLLRCGVAKPILKFHSQFLAMYNDIPLARMAKGLKKL
jgi:hypothetical protein